MLEVGDRVVDYNGYEGMVTRLVEETGQVQVMQKPNVHCTYDNATQLIKLREQAHKAMVVEVKMTEVEPVSLFLEEIARMIDDQDTPAEFRSMLEEAVNKCLQT